MKKKLSDYVSKIKMQDGQGGVKLPEKQLTDTAGQRPHLLEMWKAGEAWGDIQMLTHQRQRWP